MFSRSEDMNEYGLFVCSYCRWIWFCFCLFLFIYLFFQKIPQLDEIFHVGQAVVTRVIEINHSSEHNAKVILSSVPDVVQSDWSPRAVTTGTVVIAAVKSQEENGYVMDTGIKNVRAFLKRSAALNYEMIWNQKRPLGGFMQEMQEISDIIILM
jgi:hypothetical protein